jgi:hypothetical protein
MSRRVLCVLAWFLLCTSGYAQTLGTITGEVKDQSDATIPGATVTAQNVATNAVRTQQSNEAGVYTFPARAMWSMSRGKRGIWRALAGRTVCDRAGWR